MSDEGGSGRMSLHVVHEIWRLREKPRTEEKGQGQ
jgi:hypothetical protein